MLRAYWQIADTPIPDGARWVPLAGGRTNAVWRVETGGQQLVVKLFHPESDTPLFHNDPAAEARALKALDGTGLAPRLVAAGETPLGPSVVYAHAPGHPWTLADDPAPVAEALARLHAQPAPPRLPAVQSGAHALRDQARAILASLGTRGADLAALEPDAGPRVASGPEVFLHGDATAGNVLVDDRRVTFIDWQCPGRGDATHDLAVFLSPAMQAISGNPPLSTVQEDRFLAAYGNTVTVRRYHALASLHHWRMAAHCLWRAARGDAGYAEAAALEIDRLRTP